MNASPPTRWDVFIAHAGPDQVLAERLYDVLAERYRPFLASRCLRLGEDWDLTLSKAQRASLVTVVLVTKSTDDAFYEREEIAEAIALARAGEHIVVPVYFGSDEDDLKPPYGLRIKHGHYVQNPADDFVILRHRLSELLPRRRPDDEPDASAEVLKSELRPVLQTVRDFVEEGLLERQESELIVREILIKRFAQLGKA